MHTARVSGAGMPGVVEATVLCGGERVQIGGRTVPAGQVHFEPAADGLVYGVILNDAQALQALGEAMHQAPYQAPPKAPVLYVKPYNTHIGHGAAIALPAGADRVEVFGTLGIVLGGIVSRASEARALESVRGYTVVADLSLPQRSFHRPPIREKCFDGACPIGPWIASRDSVGDPAGLTVRVHINGKLVQQRGLADLIRPVARLIADVSAFLTLYAGDVLLAGIALEAPAARAGDIIAVEIPGVGRLENSVAQSVST